VAIRPNGNAQPCCRFRPADFSKYKQLSNVNIDFRNSDSWVNVRQKMLNGEKISECNQCYIEERSGLETPRTLKLPRRDADWPSTTNIAKLEFLEIAFSNLCNLACVSCNSTYSSTWGTEDYKRDKLSNKKVLIEHNNDLDNLDLSNIRTVKIIGGEPFMDQNRFIRLLEKLELSKINLLVSTNGTVLPNEKLKSLMDQCDELMLEVSLDGVGTVNEWYRWPTKMSKVEEVMNQYQDWWGITPKFQLKIHSVINAYNIWNLNEFVQYMNNNYPSWMTDFDWIVDPTWQTICIIPKEHKETLKKKLLIWHESIKGNWSSVKYSKNNSPFLISIDRLDDTERSEWEIFKNKSLSLAKERNLDLLTLVPLLKNII
jgi:organic radical activating enzyme